MLRDVHISKTSILYCHDHGARHRCELGLISLVSWKYFTLSGHAQKLVKNSLIIFLGQLTSLNPGFVLKLNSIFLLMMDLFEKKINANAFPCKVLSGWAKHIQLVVSDPQEIITSVSTSTSYLCCLNFFCHVLVFSSQFKLRNLFYICLPLQNASIVSDLYKYLCAWNLVFSVMKMGLIDCLSLQMVSFQQESLFNQFIWTDLSFVISSKQTYF